MTYFDCGWLERMGTGKSHVNFDQRFRGAPLGEYTSQVIEFTTLKDSRLWGLPLELKFRANSLKNVMQNFIFNESK